LDAGTTRRGGCAQIAAQTLEVRREFHDIIVASSRRLVKSLWQTRR
jgi:hypothetical protein